MASGFAVMGRVCLLNANLTSAWAAENYFRTELLMAVGQSFAFVGLVSSIILQSFSSGALGSPSRVLTFSAFFHCVRLFAGQIGIDGDDPLHRRAGETALVPARASRPIGRLDRGAHRETADRGAGGRDRPAPTRPPAARSDSSPAVFACRPTSLSFIDAFHLMAWMSVAMLILLATLRRFPLNYRDLAALGAGARQARPGDPS